MKVIETVEELIRVLQTLPASAPVYIKDADTGWLLKIDDVREKQRRVLIGSDYTYVETDEE